MILKSADKQFSISEDGQILFQPDPTNPLPGTPVGQVSKGESLLMPKATLIENEAFEGQDKDAMAAKLQEWLTKNIELALEPLFRLTRGEDLNGTAKEIADKMQMALGIMQRAEIQDLITKLDEEGRKALRARKVRMGPVLVFMPELNKPAAVRLRAFLLTLWQDKSLPADIPADGMVSFSVTDKEVDASYYQSIGYPVFGPRAIRVDMFDRVVCAVYDAAKDGKFQAQHKMAEWLGSNIADLYAVLEAMGHTKIHDPLEEKAKEESEAGSDVAEPEKTETSAPAEGEKVQTETAESASAPVVEAVKPELATFRLKRGSAAGSREPHKDRPKFDKKSGDKPKSFEKKEKKKFDHKARKDKRGRPDDREDRVYTAEAKEKADSPFAILQQLKTGNGS